MPNQLQQIEQNLSEIAVSLISEKNPNLMEYYLGFDIIDKNDDGTRAAGIMGFKIGGQLVYVPVFFLNGKVKGTEVMYLKNSDTFVANNENWVNYIANQNPQDIGEPSNEKPLPDVEGNNSLRIFTRPPASANSKAANWQDITTAALTGGLAGSAIGGAGLLIRRFLETKKNENQVKANNGQESPKIISDQEVSPLNRKFSDQEVKDMTPEQRGDDFDKLNDEIYGSGNWRTEDYSKPKSKTASREVYDLSVDEFIDTEMALAEPEKDLIDFLKQAGYETYKHFIKIATDNPEILKAVSNIYSLDELKIEFANKKVASEETENTPKDTDITGSIRLIKSAELMNLKMEMSTEEKTKTIKNGYVIKDERPEDQKSDLYLGDFREVFNQVTETGYYEILNCCGDIVKAIVLVAPKAITDDSNSLDNSGTGYTTQAVIDPENGSVEWASNPVYYKAGASIADKLDEDEKVELMKDTGIDPKSAEIRKKYFLLDKNFRAYGPFSVSDKMKESGKVTLEVEQDHIPQYNSALLSDYGTGKRYNYGFCGHWGQKAFIRIIEKEDGLPQFTKGNIVFIPKNCKLIEIKDKYSASQEKSNINKIKPGDDKTLNSLLSSRRGELVAVGKTANFDVTVLFGKQSLSFRDRSEVVFDLMSRAGLREQDAEKIASEIFENKSRKISGWALPKSDKLAYPSFITPSGQGGAARDGTPITNQESTRQEMISPGVPPTSATELDSGQWNQITKEDIDFLQRASDSNSRQVFDPGMIGVLTRTSRSQSIVQDYIPELVDNLDRMSRLLLMFYWHNSDFAEQYGIDEMADFEDLLLSTIKSTAKIVLFLKQRSVENSTTSTDAL